MTIRTHYDNLHLAPDASEAEIRQAYRRLSKQYHPDLNTDPDAHRIMQLINQAYEVLSDPKKRAEHDLWIAQQRMTRAADTMANNRPAMPNVVVTLTEATPSATKSPKKYTGAIALCGVAACRVVDWADLVRRAKRQRARHNKNAGCFERICTQKRQHAKRCKPRKAACTFGKQSQRKHGGIGSERGIYSSVCCA
ncbi:J domain-containing protein [Kingella kingae]|uniref:J domain-containing protein n=1 Tax=Kingella kingae TaxID=504 RepID=UPI0003F6D35B|nr:J domain-containing protein [Kingella kingae]